MLFKRSASFEDAFSVGAGQTASIRGVTRSGIGHLAVVSVTTTDLTQRPVVPAGPRGVGDKYGEQLVTDTAANWEA
ncbi:hypothetical protein OHA69_41185 [Streptomyces anulatus]|uniref:hypothetical protein n=1 Tax=Streptomyces anulatus TaxID=1892 RepID=UPI0022589BEA|nr:hypothetical protein [Streptomyces anulatus]MCX4524007.1 hypothetical protein [Streptomyces anulatus]